MTIKTLFRVSFFGERKDFFFEKEGDFSHLNRVFCNASKEEYWAELLDMVYTKDGYLNPDIEESLMYRPTKDWDYYVECGFVP